MPGEIHSVENVKKSPKSTEISVKETIRKTPTKDGKSQRRISFKDNSCQMLREATLDSTPSHLNELFKHFQLEAMSMSDICYQLVYLVALETGFAEKNAYKKCVEQLKIGNIVTSYFNAHNVLCLAKVKPDFKQNKSSNTYSMNLRSIASDKQLENVGIDINGISNKMTGVVTGDFMIISINPLQHEKFTNFCNTRTICLSMPRYIIGNITKDRKKSLNDCLRNMDEFEFKLRNELFVPLRSYHLHLLEFETLYPSLLGLPLEIYEIIFKYLNTNDLQNLSKVNKQFHDILKELQEKEALRFQSASSVISEASRNSSYFEVEPYFRP